MNKADKYLYEAIKNILANGYEDKNPRPHYKDGTPAHTISVNHVFRTYDISKGEFPITSLRPIAWKTAIKEILWIYQDQSSSLQLLNDKYNVNYWNSWESKDIPGSIGTRYGEVVKRYHLVDNLIKGIKVNPYGRRHIIDLYQYKELEETDGLYPCAFCSIWNIREDKYLDMTLIQRSGDLLAASCAGVNEIQYTALLMMIAKATGYEPGIFSHYIANEQLYTHETYLKAAKEILKRYEENLSTPFCYAVPKLILNTEKMNFYDFTIDDFEIKDYEPIKPQLKFELGI